MRKFTALPVFAFFLTLAAVAAPKSPHYVRAYKGKHGLVHLVTQNGHERVMPKLPQQVQVESLKISPDHRVAGWLVDYPNCCTSYPIPLRLVLVSGARKHSISPVQMIWNWCFVKKGKQVAVASGPVHGTDIPVLSLYDATTGKSLASISPRNACSFPPWATCLIPSYCKSH